MIPHQSNRFLKNDTKLLDLQKDIENLQKWFDNRNFILERLYRGTEDGFNSTGFRSKVHMKEHILIVAQSEHNKIFGGYTSLGIDKNKADGYCTDNHAFLFSLTSQTKHSLQQGHQGNAI